MPARTDGGRGNEADGFSLGSPSLVCRWRIAGRALPMANRHLRALGARRIGGEPVPRPLVAWAKEHIDWTLEDGAAPYPDGVLMLIVDGRGRAAMTVGPYEGLAHASANDLARRGLDALREGDETGVAPETVWACRGDVLVSGIGAGQRSSGTATLVTDLAHTLGIQVVREGGLASDVAAGRASFDELFLVSDEHGVVPASACAGARSRRFADGYRRLLDSSGRSR